MPCYEHHKDYFKKVNEQAKLEGAQVNWHTLALLGAFAGLAMISASAGLLSAPVATAISILKMVTILFTILEAINFAYQAKDLENNISLCEDNDLGDLAAFAGIGLYSGVVTILERFLSVLKTPFSGISMNDESLGQSFRSFFNCESKHPVGKAMQAVNEGVNQVKNLFSAGTS